MKFMHTLSVAKATSSLLFSTKQVASAYVFLRPFASSSAGLKSKNEADIFPGLKKPDGIIPSGLGQNVKLAHLSSYALLGLLPVGIAGFNPAGVVDLALAVVIPVHFHYGISQVVTDYIHNDGIYKAANVALALVTAGTFGALLSLNFNDVGITGLIRNIWSAGKKKD